MRKTRTFLVVVLALFLFVMVGCVNVLVPVKTDISEFTSTPTQVLTETPVPSSTLTSTRVPTPTLELAVENDLKPSYIQTINTEYMGVEFNLELITDSSLEPLITKITIDEMAYTQTMARNIFKIWWVKGPESHDIESMPTDTDFENFMSLWSQAQKTNNIQDWRKVQVDNVWANDLTDGDGFVQKPYSIWFLYHGDSDSIEGVRFVRLLSVSFVEISEVNNLMRTRNLFGDWDAYGMNLNAYDAVVYVGTDDLEFDKSSPAGIEYSLALLISSIGEFTNYNTGSCVCSDMTNLEFGNLHVDDVLRPAALLSYKISLYPRE